MFVKSLFSFFSKIAVIALLMNLVVPPAQAALPTAVSVRRDLIINVPNYEPWKSVSKSLHWDQSQVGFAEKIIDERKAELQKILDRFRALGADRVVQKQNDSNKKPNEYNPSLIFDFSEYYPVLDKKSFNKAIIGYKGSKKIKNAQASLPVRYLALGDYLITLKSSECSLSEFHWFNPFTWFESRCEIITPSPEQYLRASLISELWLHSPNQSFDLTRRALANLADGQYDYTLESTSSKGEVIHSPAFGVDFKLSAKTPFSKYKVSFGESKWDINFDLTISDLNIFAKHLRMLVSYSDSHDLIPQTRHFLTLCDDGSVSATEEYCDLYTDNGNTQIN